MEFSSQTVKFAMATKLEPDDAKRKPGPGPIPVWLRIPYRMRSVDALLLAWIEFRLRVRPDGILVNEREAVAKAANCRPKHVIAAESRLRTAGILVDPPPGSRDKTNQVWHVDPEALTRRLDAAGPTTRVMLADAGSIAHRVRIELFRVARSIRGVARMLGGGCRVAIRESLVRFRKYGRDRKDSLTDTVPLGADASEQTGVVLPDQIPGPETGHGGLPPPDPTAAEVAQVHAILAGAGYRSRFRWLRGRKARELVAGGITSDLLSRAWALARRIGRYPAGLLARWVDRWEIRSVVADATPPPPRRPAPRATAVQAAWGETPLGRGPQSAATILDGLLVGLGLRPALPVLAPVQLDPELARRVRLRAMWAGRDQTRGIGTRRVFG